MMLVQMVKSEELIGKWVRRQAAWGWSSNTWQIEDARFSRNGEIKVKLKGYATWRPLEGLLVLKTEPRSLE